jgi:hypothetical protein
VVILTVDDKGTQLARPASRRALVTTAYSLAEATYQNCQQKESNLHELHRLFWVKD